MILHLENELPNSYNYSSHIIWLYLLLIDM